MSDGLSVHRCAPAGAREITRGRACNSRRRDSRWISDSVKLGGQSSAKSKLRAYGIRFSALPSPPLPRTFERGQLQKGAVLEFRILPRKGAVLEFRILSSLLPRPLLLRLVLSGPHPILPDPLAHVACALQVQAVGDSILAVVRLRRASPPFSHRLSPSSRSGFFPGQRISSSAWGPPASPAKPFPPSMLRNLRDFETQPSESRRAKG